MGVQVAYHIVLSRSIDLDAITEQARQGLRPRHAIQQLADRLGASIHSPAGQVGTFLDKARSKLIGSPLLWAYGRDLVERLSSDDVIYCPDEQIGLPMAALCSRKRDRPKLAVMIHNIDRPRTAAALRLSAGVRAADMYLSVSRHQVEHLRDTIGIDGARTLFVDDQTDMSFFKPGPSELNKTRPILVSAGLEKRDYRVLAAAIEGLDVDVRITGFSADTAPANYHFPDEWPANISRRRYDWPELSQLYRDADAVVVTLVPNVYAAGITTMVEGMASGRPVIVTRTEGLEGYLDDDDALTLVPPGDADALRRAILSLLGSRDQAEAMGQRAVEIARKRYSSDVHVETIAGIMEKLGSR